MKCPLVSPIFLMRSLVFPFLLFSSILCTDHWGRLSYLSLLFFGTLHSNGYIYPFLLCFSLPFFSQLFVGPPHIVILLLWHFFFLGMILIPASYIMSWNSIHSSSGTLSDLIPWIYFSLPLYNLKGFDLDHTWMVWWFSLLSSIKEYMIWATVSSRSCFCWLYRASPS